MNNSAENGSDFNDYCHGGISWPQSPAAETMSLIRVFCRKTKLTPPGRWRLGFAHAACPDYRRKLDARRGGDYHQSSGTTPKRSRTR